MKNQSVTYATMFLALAWFGFLPQIHAVAPPPDGCYPNFTTAEGYDALSLLTTGAGNTGLVGVRSFWIRSGSFNTAVGVGALVLNNADSNTAVGAAALLLNTSGARRIRPLEAAHALLNNTTGSFNTAVR